MDWVPVHGSMIIIFFKYLIQIIGKQPNSDIRVFNCNVQMDASGRFIPIDQRRYLLEGTRNDHIVDVPTGKQAVDHIFLPS